MKSLKQHLREKLLENDVSEDVSYIILSVNSKITKELNIINEGIWKSSNHKDYWHRVDNANFDFEQKHIHIAHKKHINSKTKQVSWNLDTSRHDKKTFDTNFKGIENAKNIAIKVLNLPKDTLLENITNLNKNELILENMDSNLKKVNTYFLEIK